MITFFVVYIILIEKAPFVNAMRNILDCNRLKNRKKNQIDKLLSKEN